jgi:hypothetical protein
MKRTLETFRIYIYGLVNFGSAFCRLCTWGDDLLLPKREPIFKVDKTWLIIKCVCYWERSKTCKKEEERWAVLDLICEQNLEGYYVHACI